MMTVVARSVLHSRSDVTWFGTLRNPGLSFTRRAKSMLAVTTAKKGDAQSSITVCRLYPSGMGFCDTIISSSPSVRKAHASARAKSPRNTLSRAFFLLFIKRVDTVSGFGFISTVIFASPNGALSLLLSAPIRLARPPFGGRASSSELTGFYEAQRSKNQCSDSLESFHAPNDLKLQYLWLFFCQST